MSNPFLINPFLIFLISFAAFWIASLIGRWFGDRALKLEEKHRDDFKFVLGGSLTLLGLIIGFTFSMAVGRYDQRKNLEEEEANAIGTEYVRADLLPAADAPKVRGLLRAYADQRILFYTSSDGEQLRRINAETARLQGEMWRVVTAYASGQPTPVAALVVSGMN